MAESKAHKATANRIAAKYKTQYNQGPGADIKTNNIAVEVETEDTIGDAARQLRGHKKPSYVAVTNQRSVQKALDHYADTTIGVMDPNGKVVKRSTRGREAGHKNPKAKGGTVATRTVRSSKKTGTVARSAVKRAVRKR